MSSSTSGWSAFAGGTIYLDTNIVIYAVETGNPWSSTLRDLFAAIDQRAIHAVTSELTLAEVIAKPLEMNTSELVGKYETMLSGKGILRVVPIDRNILLEAARLRGTLRLKLLDAIHLATAINQSCDVFLTNDDRLKKAVGPKIRGIDLWEIAGMSGLET